MTFVDGILVLIIGAGGEFAAADAANQLAVFLDRFDSLEGDVVGVVVVVGAEAAARITSYNVCYTKLLRCWEKEDGSIATRG